MIQKFLYLRIPLKLVRKYVAKLRQQHQLIQNSTKYKFHRAAGISVLAKLLEEKHLHATKDQENSFSVKHKHKKKFKKKKNNNNKNKLLMVIMIYGKQTNDTDTYTKIPWNLPQTHTTPKMTVTDFRNINTPYSNSPQTDNTARLF